MGACIDVTSGFGKISADGQRENMRMRSLTGMTRHMMVAAMIALVGILALGGCAKKSVMSSTEGAGKAQAGAAGTTERGPGGSSGFGGSMGEGGSAPGESGSAPLQGFSKSPAEEAVKPPTPPMVVKADQGEIAARQAREAAKRGLGDIYFEYDKWALSGEGKKNLAQNAELLKQNPTVKILIEGHCDERGSREYNMVLGEKRAQETRRYLEALGVKNPVTVTSYGKERPVCTDPEESCYWKNRRAHLVLEGER
jgi:peptidoglycan-associated lipoprotein